MKLLKLLLLSIIVVIFVLAFSYQKIISNLLLPQYISWAHDINANGLKLGTPLDEKQLLLATAIGIQNPEKVRLVFVDEVPFPYENYALKIFGEALGFVGEGIVNNAQVFGYSIYIRKEYTLNKPRLAHELVHVLQIERSDLETIISQYFFELAKYGYENAPLEVEAFKANKKYSEE